MVCRAPSGATNCSGGANTGQQLTWDLEGRLAAWQDAPTSPTTTAGYLYDGEGQRVAQRVTASGATTTTTYVGSLAEYTTTGGATTSTDYLYAAGKLVAEAVTSGTPSTTTLNYLVTNAQGTPLEALDGSGNVTASRLYTPYGGSRYTSGAFPTSYGYTGQRADATTGLDYYSARYYDPTIGQFSSADTVLDGLNRYGYVGGNPTSRTDPSGHMGAATDYKGVPQAMPEGAKNENLQGAERTNGGGGGIDPWLVVKAIGGLVGAVGGGISDFFAIPTASAPGITTTDDGTPAYNARTFYQTFYNTWYGPEGRMARPCSMRGPPPRVRRLRRPHHLLHHLPRRHRRRKPVGVA